MASLTPRITEIINEQGYEITRNMIALIIKCELENQKTLNNAVSPTDPNYNPINEDIKVFIGRAIPFEQAEDLVINVSLQSWNTTSQSQRGVHVTADYVVDFYVRARQRAGANPGEQIDGGQAATEKRDRFTGLVRSILQDHRYRNLALETLGIQNATTLIMGTTVKSLENYEPENNNDSSFVKMARLTLEARINENAGLWSGVIASGIFTNIRLGNTNIGTQYENNLTP